MATKYRKYVIARGANKRPLTQHIRIRSQANITLCGRMVNGWSIEYTEKPLKVLLCLKCKQMEALGYE